MLIGILVLAVAVLLLFGRAGFRISATEKDKARIRWKNIKELANSDDEHALTKAIFEADKLLDWSMGLAGVRGNGLGEKLKVAKTRVINLDGVWRAHKLRNQLAHEMDVRINKRDVQVALSAFESALKGFGLLQ